MIIGKGLLAKSLKNCDREDILFIAAGVSDSKCTDEPEFDRERKMVMNLVKNHQHKVIVFFSTFSINDPVMAQSAYVTSKWKLENYIQQHCPKYLIIRVSNLVGQGGNSKTVFNFLFNQIINDNRFSLWAKSQRNLIMAEDFTKILNYIITSELDSKINSILNIINIRSFSVQEIVTAIENHTGKKALYDLVEIESIPDRIDEHSKEMFEILGIETDNYLERILKKYFSEYAITATRQSFRA